MRRQLFFAVIATARCPSQPLPQHWSSRAASFHLRSDRASGCLPGAIRRARCLLEVRHVDH